MRHVVAQLADLHPGSKRLVQVQGTDVLLCNIDGVVSALHPKCTHYGAPLIDGVLNGHRLVCPWHHACFDARDGRHLEAPGCDALRTYPVDVEGGQIFVTLPQNTSHASDGQHPNPMVAGGSPAERPYVVVGGGPAGQHTVEGLRQGGYSGPITLISQETHLPYDRTQVSKGFLKGERPASKMPLRPQKFYDEHRVELLLGKTVDRIDTDSHTLHFADGNTLNYARLCVATGSTPRRLEVPGAELPAIYSLRTWEDAEAIRSAAGKGKKAVVIGSSFIGLESAMVLADLGCKVTVVSPDEVPFEKVFGARIGKAIQSWHEANGICFKLGEEVSGFEGVRKVTAVRLASGSKLPASLVVVGIGVQPNTSLLADLPTADNGGIQVDEHQSAGQDIWVAGDIASAPQGMHGGHVRIEHWRVAEQQGTVAGNNMAGAQRTLMSVPFFWTNQAGKNLRYAGHHRNADNIVFDGSPEDGAFIAYYVEGDRISAALGHGRDRELAAIHELMWLGKMPSAEELKPHADWVKLLEEASR